MWSLGKVVAQVPTAGGVAELAERLGFNLSDALTGDVEVFADFLECVVLAVQETETHLKDLPFPLG